MVRALALGNFDGVHRGHQALLAATVAAAQQQRLQPAALVIEPVPVATRLLSAARQEARLRAAGMAECLRVALDAELRCLRPEAFVALLRERWQAAAVLAGENFRFGCGAAGDAAALRALGAAQGLAVTVVPLLHADGAVVSSTRLRTLVQAGDLDGAAALLGAPAEVTGTVQRGAERGRELGFPTANLACPQAVLPPYGVYAVRVAVDDGWHDGLLHYGVRPTFAEDTRGPLVEVHLLDWQGELYGRELTVQLLARVRGERCCANREALTALMRSDEQQAREALTVHAVGR